MKISIALLTTVILYGLIACDSGPRSPVGFLLPEGDVEQGEAAFLELHCNKRYRIVEYEERCDANEIQQQSRIECCLRKERIVWHSPFTLKYQHRGTFCLFF